MPIAFSKTTTIPIYLDVDIAEYPDEKTRPAFICRFPSIEDAIVMAEAVKRASELALAGKSAESNLVVKEMLQRVIVGFENMPGLTWENLTEKLTEIEFFELARKVQTQPQLSEIDRKKSVSPASTPTVASAASAPQQANAESGAPTSTHS